ncbi:MAG: hypothetical protein EXS50_00580 [Candidatus Taylorbacteria bacterium]|nr:hypothetical protein [Candidatus Taylorbacteria bacterium]
MEHYVCTGGCGGESKDQGVCDAQFCKKEGQVLTSCSCADGMHENPGVSNIEKDDSDLGE